MTVGTDNLVTAEMLRDFLERLKAGADRDTHPLTTLLLPLPGFCHHVDGAGDRHTAADKLARGLRAVWRERLMPPALNAGLQVGWNAYFILEVLYFYPHARQVRFPGTLKEAAMLLCDAEHLALIVADGDQVQARRLTDHNQDFWARFIPANMTPAEQTLHSRRDASLRKLAQELNRLLPTVVSTMEHEANEPSRAANQAQTGSLPIPEGRTQTAGHRAAEGPLQAVQEAPEVEAEPQASEPPIGRGGLPLSPNARRLYEAYGGFLPLPPTRNQAFPANGPRTHPQSLLQRLVELGPAIKPAHLDELALWLWQLGFPQALGVKKPVTEGVWWWDEEHYQGRLVEMFQTTPNDAEQLQCAAALRQSSLAVQVREHARQWPFLEYRWVPALEVVADVALVHIHGTTRHAVAVAVLTKYDFALRLMAGEHVYQELAEQIVVQLQQMPQYPGNHPRVKDASDELRE